MSTYKYNNMRRLLKIEDTSLMLDGVHCGWLCPPTTGRLEWTAVMHWQPTGPELRAIANALDELTHPGGEDDYWA